MSECNPACRAKIILNSGNIAGITRANFSVIDKLSLEEFENIDGIELIKLLNRMEDDAVRVQKILVKGVGYSGLTGKMLED